MTTGGNPPVGTSCHLWQGMPRGGQIVVRPRTRYGEPMPHAVRSAAGRGMRSVVASGQLVVASRLGRAVFAVRGRRSGRGRPRRVSAQTHARCALAIRRFATRGHALSGRTQARVQAAPSRAGRCAFVVGACHNQPVERTAFGRRSPARYTS
jgi:hypothetical protein